MASMEMAGWFEHYLPGIGGGAGMPGGCWVARMTTRTAEHNPPFYWLARALDAVDEAGEGAAFRRRFIAAHGAQPCAGRADLERRDDRAQAVLSEACAFAWTAMHLGVPRFEPAAEGATLELGPVRLHVAAHEAYVAPVRLPAHASMAGALQTVATLTQQAAALLPAGAARVLYLDVGFEHFYPEHVGYALDLTEPVEAELRHGCAEGGLGYVLTRPFQWGNPVATSY